MRAVMFTRRLALSVWLGLLTLVVAAIAVGHGAPLLGYRLVIIQGPSMSPNLPVGALAFEQTVSAADLRPGDIVTFSLPNGAVVTHRIVRVAGVGPAAQVETKGDANGTPDPALHPVSGISGIVRGSLPVAGFLFAFLTLPTGMLSVVSALGCLLLTVWLLEDVERERRDIRVPVEAPPAGLDGLPA